MQNPTVSTMSLLLVTLALAGCSDDGKPPADPPGSHDFGEVCIANVPAAEQLCADHLKCADASLVQDCGFCTLECERDEDCPTRGGKSPFCLGDCAWECQTDADCPTELEVRMKCETPTCVPECDPTGG